MTQQAEQLRSLAGIDLSRTSPTELSELYTQSLHAGMFGLCFSSYLEGQAPGDQVSEYQIRDRLGVIAPYTKWIRSFSCTDGNERIPAIAKENGLKTLVGAWLGKDEDKNRRELQNLFRVVRDGNADIVAVGNEVLYRKDMTEEQILEYIHLVKKEFPETRIGYVDAYYEFCNRPKLTEACDVVLANCYPYWEGCEFSYSLLYMKDMYRRVLAAAEGKPVIITETGWPNAGTNDDGAMPAVENAMAYFINTQQWSKEDNIDIFYFSSFDEAWKAGDEGDVGAYWGLWDSEGKLKFVN